MSSIIILIGCLLSVPSEGQEVTSLLQVGVKAHNQVPPMPSQVTDKVIQLGMAGSQKEGDIPPEIVCHSMGCAEVKATLEGLQAALKVKQAALAECGKARAQLQKDLAEAGKQRAKAEIALAKCAKERKELAAELYQCANVDRPAAEKALAECARDRAKLEAELSQCANIDRPEAEKKLAECAQERAELEKELAKLIQKMKGKAEGGSTAGGAGRRRRRNARRRSSLAQQNSSESSLLQEESEEGTESMAALQMRKADVEKSLSDLALEAKTLQQKIKTLDATVDGITSEIGAIDARADSASAELEATNAKEGNATENLATAENTTEELLGKIDNANQQIENASDAIVQSENAVEQANADVQTIKTQLGGSLLQLISLIQKEQHVLHSNLLEQTKNATAMVNTHEATLSILASTGASKDACDAARVEIIKTKTAIAVTTSALNACLEAKKVITVKIDAAMAEGEKAQKALAKCLQNKVELKAKIKACHDKRDAAREKLKACLERKKVLKKQIDACHTKRDEARAKLKECLSRKAALKGKISDMKAKVGPQKRLSLAEVAELEEQMPNTLEEAEAALEALHHSDTLLQEALAQLTEATAEEQAQIEQLIKEGDLTDHASEDVANADAAEAEADAGMDEMVDALKFVLSELRTAGSEVQAAAAANDAANSQVNELQITLKKMMM